MSLRMPVWRRKLLLICSALAALMPFISVSFSGSDSSISRDLSPNFPTMSDAVAGPTPLMVPPERYAYIAGAEVGIMRWANSALNWRPWVL